MRGLGVAFASVALLLPRGAVSAPSAEAGGADSAAAPAAAAAAVHVAAGDADSAPVPPALATPVLAPPAGAAPPSITRRGFSAGAAVVPGLVLHGAGHFALGERKTAWRLLRWQGAGFGSFVLGLGGLVATGASSRTIAVFIPLAAIGAGLFAVTWASDLYGVLAPPGGLGQAPRALPPVVAEAGARYVYDRVLAYRGFFVTGLDIRLAGFRISPSVWAAVGHDNARYRLEGAYRFLGAGARAPGGGSRATTPPAPVDGRGVSDGSYLDLEAAFTHHRYGAERFALTLGEMSLHGRLDMRRAAPSLAGSFVEMSLGFALGGITYFDVKTTDATDLLLVRFGWGMFFGRTPDRQGEVLVYYDHRHDGFAAGLKMPGLGSGPVGHFGLRAAAFVSSRFGFLVDVQAGSAYVAGASLLLRQGSPP